MKVIDIQRKGNLLRFCLGDDDCNDYYGDDWNDAPWQDNAGSVYSQFVRKVIDVVFNWKYGIEDSYNTEYGYCTMEDIKAGLPYYFITIDEDSCWGKLVGVLNLNTPENELKELLKKYDAKIIEERDWNEE